MGLKVNPKGWGGESKGGGKEGVGWAGPNVSDITNTLLLLDVDLR